VALAAILTTPQRPPLRAISALAGIAAIGWMGWRDAVILPIQPIREGIALADRLAPPGVDLLCCYLGGREAAALYPDAAPSHVLLAAPDLQWWRIDEQVAITNTGQRPWVIFFYENLAYRRDHDTDSLGVWSYLTANYRLVKRLDGKIPVGIYAPRTEPHVAVATSLGTEFPKPVSRGG
jgi:hypothetical protein